MSTRSLNYDASLPDGTVPDSSSSVFVSIEGTFLLVVDLWGESEMIVSLWLCSHVTEVGFGNSQASYLLSPEVVATLIELPTGCVEQTMVKLAPTTFALRYLDLSEQWFNLPAGKRDEALDKIETGENRLKLGLAEVGKQRLLTF